MRPPERDTLVSGCRQRSYDGSSLRTTLKRAIKPLGYGKTVRVVKLSCLDICPKGAVAVAVAVADDRMPERRVRYFNVAGGADPKCVAAVLRP